MMAVATTTIDSLARNSVSGCSEGTRVTSSPPEKAAMPPATPKAVSFIRVGDTVDAAAISSLSRTAIHDRPIPVRRSRATTAAATASETRHRK